MNFSWMGIRKQHLLNRHREIRLLQLVDLRRQGVRRFVFVQADAGLQDDFSAVVQLVDIMDGNA